MYLQSDTGISVEMRGYKVEAYNVDNLTYQAFLERWFCVTTFAQTREAGQVLISIKVCVAPMNIQKTSPVGELGARGS